MVVSMLSQQCLLEGLRVREGGVVGTLSALEANDSQEDFVVRGSELGEVFHAERPRHTPAQHGLNHLGLQRADFQTQPGGRHIMYHGIQLRVEPFEACILEMDPS